MKRLLVADDKLGGREFVRAVLERSGYAIYEACDGAEALHTARQIHPDLIVLDLNMPEMDGFSVVRELRRDPDLAATPILALTASAMQDERERAMAAGFNGYVTKPIGPRQLRAEVERLLQNHPCDERT